MTLDAVFNTSIAFLIWHRLNQETFSHPSRLCVIWQKAVTQLVAGIGLTQGDGQLNPVDQQRLFADIAATAATEALDDDHDPELCTVTTDTSQKCLRHTLNELIHCVQNFRKLAQDAAAARSHGRKTATAAASDSASVEAQSTSAQHRLSSSATSCHTVLLRSILLVLKLSCLLTSVPATTATAESAVTSMWWTIKGLCNSIADYDHGDSNACAYPESNSSKDKDVASVTEQEPQLSVLLVQLVMPVLRKMINSKAILADVCLKLLLVLMPKSRKSTFRAVAAEVVESGTGLICKCCCNQTHTLHDVVQYMKGMKASVRKQRYCCICSLTFDCIASDTFCSMCTLCQQQHLSYQVLSVDSPVEFQGQEMLLIDIVKLQCLKLQCV